MDDSTWMLSLMQTTNITAIEKLYFYEPQETTTSINSALLALSNNASLTFSFSTKRIIDWIIDNIELNRELLNYLFGLVVRDNYRHTSATNNSTTLKLINMGARAEKTEELINLSSESFFEYISRNEYEININNVKYMFRFNIDEKVRNYLYNSLIHMELHIDDVYIILSSTCDHCSFHHCRELQEFIKIASQNIYFDECIYCIIFSYPHILKNMTYYGFYDEIIFLQKILICARGLINNPGNIESNLILSAINSNEEATQLYKSIIARPRVKPSQLSYEEVIQDVISLKNIIDKKFLTF